MAGVHDAEWCRRLAERLGLAKLLDRYPEQLSGGQQQRVAIGRALAGRPRLILADEPTGNLDEATGDAVLDLMLALQAETGAGLLLVTHSLRLASQARAAAEPRGRDARLMLWQAFRALLSHWRTRPLQLAMLLLGLALATALWSAVQAINGEARSSYARAAAVIGQDRFSVLARDDGARFSERIYVDLRRAGWLVSPVIEGEKRFGDVRLRVLGIDPLSLPQGASQVDIAGEAIGLEPFITPPGVLVVSPDTAQRLSGQETPPLRTAAELPPGTALADIGIAQRLLGEEGRVSRLILWPEQLPSARSLREVAPELVQKPPAVESDLSRLTDSFHLNLTAFGFLAFAVGLFIVYSAIGLAFEQRRAMFRTMRALGLPLKTLVLLLCAELLTLSLAAGLLGVAMGYGVASLLLPDVAATLKGLYGAEVPGSLSVRPSVWLLGLAIAVAGSMGSAATQLWRIMRMPLLAPARPARLEPRLGAHGGASGDGRRCCCSRPRPCSRRGAQAWPRALRRWARCCWVPHFCCRCCCRVF